jgi:hypothetical protein
MGFIFSLKVVPGEKIMKVVCKFWGHNFYDDGCASICQRCGFIENYGLEDFSWNWREKVYWKFYELRLKTSSETCGYCKRRLKILGIKVGECADDCLPF